MSWTYKDLLRTSFMLRNLQPQKCCTSFMLRNLQPQKCCRCKRSITEEASKIPAKLELMSHIPNPYMSILWSNHCGQTGMCKCSHRHQATHDAPVAAETAMWQMVHKSHKRFSPPKRENNLEKGKQLLRKLKGAVNTPLSHLKCSVWLHANVESKTW